MTIVTVHEAKTHLSRLINRVLAGEEITVARRTEQVIKLVPVHAAKKSTHELGWLAHTLSADKQVTASGIPILC